MKLSFLILLCVTEDQYANALMHDPNLVFSVKLHKAPMRHRKISATDGAFASGQSKSLACSVMDLMVEFIRSHLMKRVSTIGPKHFWSRIWTLKKKIFRSTKKWWILIFSFQIIKALKQFYIVFEIWVRWELAYKKKNLWLLPKMPFLSKKWLI